MKFVENNQIILNSQQRLQCKVHNVFTEAFNKLALSADNDKRLQTLNGVTSYPRSQGAGKV